MGEQVRQRCVRTMAVTRRQAGSEAKVKELPGAARSLANHQSVGPPEPHLIPTRNETAAKRPSVPFSFDI